MSREKIGRMTAMQNVHDRAGVIERIVQEEYCDEDTDAADLAMDEIMQTPGDTNQQIAMRVAQRILQP